MATSRYGQGSSSIPITQNCSPIQRGQSWDGSRRRHPTADSQSQQGYLRRERSEPQLIPEPKRRLFGSKRSDYSGINLDNYEDKYPPDAYGEEMDADARVWRVYLDEAGPYTSGMIESFRDNLDLLMVFAGLFSAVVATTAVQSAQSLQPDYAQITASLLDELISVTRANSGGIPANSIPRAALTSTSPFTPSALMLWVNRLWFTSLALSLATALIAVLAKQWLSYFVSSISGTPRDRVRMLQFRHLNFKRWGVPIIIGMLPVLIHISLMAYFIGLVLFLIPLDHIAAFAVLFITSIGCLAYTIVNFLPLIFPHCPYKTPLSVHAYPFWGCCVSLFALARRATLSVFRRRTFDSCSPAKCQRRWRHHSLQHAEAATVKVHHETLDIASLSWLLKTSTNPSVSNVVLQSFSGLPLESTARPNTDLLAQMYPAICHNIRQSILDRTNQRDDAALAISDDRLERFTRSMLQLYPPASSDPYVLLKWSKYNNLPPRLDAVKAYGIFESDDAPSYLVQHCTTLELHPVVWMHLLQQAHSAAIGNRRLCNGKFEKMCQLTWPLALDFLQQGSVLYRVTQKGPTTLIPTGYMQVSGRLMEYLHVLYCPWGTQCRYSSSVLSVTPSFLHLFVCIWIFGRKQPCSSSDTTSLIQNLERIIKHSDDKLAYYEICDIIGMLVESGRFLADPGLVSAAPGILRVFNMLVTVDEGYHDRGMDKSLLLRCGSHVRGGRSGRCAQN